MPDVEGPEGLLNEYELRQQLASLLPEKIRTSFTQERPIEIRPINPVNPFAPTKQEALVITGCAPKINCPMIRYCTNVL